jgi:hypothetical protein
VGDPRLEMIDKPRSVVEHGDGPGQAYAPFNGSGPGGWPSADDDAGTMTDGWKVP